MKPMARLGLLFVSALTGGGLLFGGIGTAQADTTGTNQAPVVQTVPTHPSTPSTNGDHGKKGGDEKRKLPRGHKRPGDHGKKAHKPGKGHVRTVVIREPVTKWTCARWLPKPTFRVVGVKYRRHLRIVIVRVIFYKHAPWCQKHRGHDGKKGDHKSHKPGKGHDHKGTTHRPSGRDGGKSPASHRMHKVYPHKGKVVKWHKRHVRHGKVTHRRTPAKHCKTHRPVHHKHYHRCPPRHIKKCHGKRPSMRHGPIYRTQRTA